MTHVGRQHGSHQHGWHEPTHHWRVCPGGKWQQRLQQQWQRPARPGSLDGQNESFASEAIFKPPGAAAVPQPRFVARRIAAGTLVVTPSALGSTAASYVDSDSDGTTARGGLSRRGSGVSNDWSVDVVYVAPSN